jgi:predicted nucleotide-binding protein
MNNHIQTTENKIATLEMFKQTLKTWKSLPEDSDEKGNIRTIINQNVNSVISILHETNCFQYITAKDPKYKSGFIRKKTNPFSYIFNDLYPYDVQQFIVDIIDISIGALKSGNYKNQKPDILSEQEPTTNHLNNENVFIVHGHDYETLSTVTAFLKKINLNPIILHEQPSSGKTIIEKIEKYSKVSYAIILLTPDDLGAKKEDNPTYKNRARQNVILELGYFLAKLGRTHVAALVKDNIETPSDFDGVVYIKINKTILWQEELIREMKAAGLAINHNLIDA